MEVPQIQYIDEVVDVPMVKHMQVPTVVKQQKDGVGPVGLSGVPKGSKRGLGVPAVRRRCTCHRWNTWMRMWRCL